MKSSKARTVGGMGMGLVAIGLFIGLMFKGPGLGGGGWGLGGSSDGKSANEIPDLTHVKVAAPGSEAKSNEVQPQPASEAAETRLKYVTVVIHGDGYRLAPSGDPATGIPIELGALLDQIKQAPGTPEGIRVRVMLHTSAREGARADLLAQLQQLGIKPEEIQEVSEFVK